jgi:hypothetical protein
MKSTVPCSEVTINNFIFIICIMCHYQGWPIARSCIGQAPQHLTSNIKLSFDEFLIYLNFTRHKSSLMDFKYVYVLYGIREFLESTEKLLRLHDVHGRPRLTGPDLNSLFHRTSLLLMVLSR